MRSIPARHRILAISFCLILLMLAVLGFIVWRAWTQPTAGRIVQSASKPTTALSAEHQLEARLFRLKYAYFYHANSRAQSADPLAEQYIFPAPGRTGKQLAVAIEALPTGALIDNGSYKMRRATPETYHQLDRVIAKQDFVVMARSDNTEVVAFLAHDHEIVTIALVSGMGDDLVAELDEILASFSWK